MFSPTYLWVGNMGIKKKVHLTGRATLCVILPKQLARVLGIQRGSYVEIDIVKNGDMAIVIRPVRAGEEGREEGTSVER